MVPWEHDVLGKRHAFQKCVLDIFWNPVQFFRVQGYNRAVFLTEKFSVIGLAEPGNIGGQLLEASGKLS